MTELIEEVKIVIPRTRKMKKIEKKATIVGKKADKEQAAKMKEHKCVNCGHVEITVEPKKEKKLKKEDKDCKLCCGSYKIAKEHLKDEKHVKCKEFLEELQKMSVDQLSKAREAVEKLE